MKYLVALVIFSYQIIGIFSRPDIRYVNVDNTSVTSIETNTDTDSDWTLQLKLGLINSEIGPTVEDSSSFDCNSSGNQSNHGFGRIKDRESLDKDFIADLGGKMYYFETNRKANFYEAMEFCRKHGMELASLETEDENDIIMDYLKTELNNMDHFWISGNDLGKEKHFTWLSTGESFTFTKWGGSQPDDDNGLEDCVEIRKFGALVWNDEVCLNSQYFICEARECTGCRNS